MNDKRRNIIYEVNGTMLPLISYPGQEVLFEVIQNRAGTFSEDIDRAVDGILADVRANGDTALLAYTRRFDGVAPASIAVLPDALAAAYAEMDPALRDIIAEAAANIRRFHERQRAQSWFVEEPDGVVLGQRVVPIERAGVYVPGGTAVYPSSVLMNVIPAQVAGVPHIHLVSPPGPDGLPHPLVMGTAHFLGVQTVYAVGGAQAIAALAYGTASIPKVDKIVGPGNAYVAAAKKKVYGPVAIDSVAGPSEIVVLADASAAPAFVAADLLSQAEHDARASAVLVTPHRPLAEAVQACITQWWPRLQRKEMLTSALSTYSAAVVTETMDQAIELVNILAAEHLELLVEEPWAVLPHIRHAGAIFMGAYASEPVGDYFAGPNHVLPTGGTARYASALGVDDFIRKQSIISYTAARLRETGPRIIQFAEAEGLPAHAEAIRVRMEQLG